MTTAAAPARSKAPLAMSLAVAARAAERIAETIRESRTCSQVHIAGSVRRGKAEGIHDIDMVLAPHLRDPQDLRSGWRTEFLDFIASCPLWRTPERAGDSAQGNLPGLDGSGVRPSARQITLHSRKDTRLKIELWLATPANLGWILLLRTGPSDFTHALVTAMRYQGLGLTPEQRAAFDPNDEECERYFSGDGTIMFGSPRRAYSRSHSGEHYPGAKRTRTPTEESVFDELGLPFIAPQDRTADSLRRAIQEAGA